MAGWPCSEANGRDTRFGDLSVFVGLDAADTDRTQASAVFHDRHAAFEHALDGWGRQEGIATAIDLSLIHISEPTRRS